MRCPNCCCPSVREIRRNEFQCQGCGTTFTVGERRY